MYNIKTDSEAPSISMSIATTIFTEHLVNGKKTNEHLLKTATLQCLSNDPTLIKYIPSPTEEMYEAVIDADALCINLIDNPSKELCRKAILENSYAFRYIDNPDKDLCMFAISKDRHNLKYINVPDWQMCQALLNIAPPAVQLKDESEVTLQDWVILASKIDATLGYDGFVPNIRNAYLVLFRVPMIKDNLIEFGNGVIDLVPTHYTYLIESISFYSEQNGEDSEYYKAYQSLLKDDVWLIRKNTNLGLDSTVITKTSADSSLTTIFGYDKDSASISVSAPKDSTFKSCYTAIKTKVKDVYDRVRSVKDYTKVN